jgi:hypothetical protein
MPASASAGRRTRTAVTSDKRRRPHTFNATDIERFCTLVAAGDNYTEAARLAERFEATAGVPTPTSVFAQRGQKLASKPAVQARIAELKAAAEEQSRAKYAVDRDWVLRKLIDNANRSMQAEPVRDADGNPTGEYRYDGTTANRALELIGKEFGMFVQRHEHRHTLETLTDEQLLARAHNALLKLTAIEAAEGGADSGDRGDGGGAPAPLN